jgi:hypothetical protein
MLEPSQVTHTDQAASMVTPYIPRLSELGYGAYGLIIETNPKLAFAILGREISERTDDTVANGLENVDHDMSNVPAEITAAPDVGESEHTFSDLC